MAAFKNTINSISFFISHPLTKNQICKTLLRILVWQIGARLLRKPMLISWVDDTRLFIEKGMTGATGNYYCGLHEFNDMGFLLHFLQPNELFLDIGANVGTYTVLAACGRRAKVYSFEPSPSTFYRLIDNVHINNASSLVTLKNIGLGAVTGHLQFTTSLDTENHVVNPADTTAHHATPIQIMLLDDALEGETLKPVMIKMDVEGFETEVIKGGEKIFSCSELEAVLVELNGSGLRYGFDEQAIREKFLAWGFQPCSYDPYSRVVQVLDVSLISNSGNTLYVKNIEQTRQKLFAARPFKVLGQTI